MDPEARQRRLLALMKRVARAQSALEPGVTVVEDLHWLDPASEVFLANQVEADPGDAQPGDRQLPPRVRRAVGVAVRSTARSRWRRSATSRSTSCSPRLLGPDPSLAEPARLIRERTGGNPFFVEELVRALVEAGSLDGERGAYRLVAPVTGAEVPSSVQAVLAARIDRLAPHDKAVLQAAAVIGKEFAAGVLERVARAGAGPAGRRAGSPACAGEFVHEREPEPEALYAFRHPLTREVAYGSQLRERRALVHAAVARAIAEQYPERLNERAALLAQHWEAAGARRWRRPTGTRAPPSGRAPATPHRPCGTGSRSASSPTRSPTRRSTCRCA